MRVMTLPAAQPQSACYAPLRYAILEALTVEPGRPLTSDYRRRHGLPSPSSVQRALDGLERAELIGRDHGAAWINEPFFEQWLVRGYA
jgi:hypothetical protein